MKNLLYRPIQNLKSIDAGMIVFVGVVGTALLFFLLPAEAPGAISKTFSFLFSPSFAETEQVVKSTPFDSVATQVVTQRYQLLNWFKIAFWLMTAAMILMFLFKKPQVELSDEKNEILQNNR